MSSIAGDSGEVGRMEAAPGLPMDGAQLGEQLVKML